MLFVFMTVPLIRCLKFCEVISINVREPFVLIVGFHSDDIKISTVALGSVALAIKLYILLSLSQIVPII